MLDHESFHIVKGRACRDWGHSIRMQLFVIFALLSIMNVDFINAADPDPLTDFATGLESFTLRDIFTNGDVTIDSGGIRAETTVEKFPATRSQGLQYVRFKMVPCGVNLPHSHPRATEMLILISGGPLQVGFVDTQGEAFIDILHPGDVTIFPRGTINFELNVGNEEADYISSLNSQNPGIMTSSMSIMKLPLRTVATAFNITAKAVKKLDSTINGIGRGLKKTTKRDCVPGRDITVEF